MHTHTETLKFIEKAFGPAQLTKGGLEANVVCPVCAEDTGETTKKKLAIRTDNWLTHCWVCGYHGRSVYPLLYKYHPQLLEEYVSQYNGVGFLGAEALAEAAEWEESQKTTLPHGFMLLADWYHNPEAPWYVKQAKNYLLGRGISYEDCWYFKLGVTEDPLYKNRVIIPSFNDKGILDFYVGRAVKRGVYPTYFNPKLNREDLVFNELNIDWSQPLTIVEGPFDLMKANQNATCLLGKELADHFRLFRKIVLSNIPVLLALDANAERETVKIAKLLTSYGVEVRIYRYPPKTKDPGDMTKLSFMSGMQDAMVYTDWDWVKHKLNVETHQQLP